MDVIDSVSADSEGSEKQGNYLRGYLNRPEQTADRNMDIKRAVGKAQMEMRDMFLVASGKGIS